GGCPSLTFHAGARRGTGSRRHSDGCALSPLEIGLQAIQPWPYRAGLAARHPGRLQTTTASLACSGPLALSRSGEPGDPGTLLQVPPNCIRDATKRLTAHTGREALASSGSYDPASGRTPAC